MSPEAGGEKVVRMPDRRRMGQRLGMLTIGNDSRQTILSILGQRETDPFSHENFVGILDDSITEAVKSNKNLGREQLREKVPRMIVLLLDDTQDKREALSIWFTNRYREDTDERRQQRLTDWLSSQSPEDEPPALRTEAERRQAITLYIASLVEGELGDDPSRKEKIRQRNAARTSHVRTHTTINGAASRRSHHGSK